MKESDILYEACLSLPIPSECHLDICFVPVFRTIQEVVFREIEDVPEIAPFYTIEFEKRCPHGIFGWSFK